MKTISVFLMAAAGVFCQSAVAEAKPFPYVSEVRCTERTNIGSPAAPTIVETQLTGDMKYSVQPQLGNLSGIVTLNDSRGNRVVFNHGRQVAAYGGFTGWIVSVYKGEVGSETLMEVQLQEERFPEHITLRYPSIGYMQCVTTVE